MAGLGGSASVAGNASIRVGVVSQDEVLSSDTLAGANPMWGTDQPFTYFWIAWVVSVIVLFIIL